jgi:hypothetical protein
MRKTGGKSQSLKGERKQPAVSTVGLMRATK